jgi:hypothetical protein
MTHSHAHHLVAADVGQTKGLKEISVYPQECY